MLSPQLSPFGEFVLGAGAVHLGADLEELAFELALLLSGLGCRRGEAVEEIP
jgi:hypothetical protein